MESTFDLDRTHDTPASVSPPLLDRPEETDLSLAGLRSALGNNKRSIFRAVIVTAAVAIPAVFLIPVKYRAETVILTPQQAHSSLSDMAQLSGAGTAVALSPLSLLSGFGLRNPADFYIGMLQSRTIADALIDQFRLQDVYHTTYRVTARKRLEQNTTIKSAKDSLIHIQVEDKDPRRAAALANAYVEELSSRNSKLAYAEAYERRLFYEKELAAEKDALADAEVALQNTEQATGLVAPGGQAEALVRSGAELRAQILARQAQLAAMKTYATDNNPRLQILQRELGALQAEFNNFQRGEHKTGTLEIPTGQLPEAALKYIRRLRDVKYHETLFEVLAKQYEAARLDEAKSAPLIQVVDEAVVPEKKAWPPRTLLVCAAILIVWLFSCIRFVLRASRAPARSASVFDKLKEPIVTKRSG